MQSITKKTLMLVWNINVYYFNMINIENLDVVEITRSFAGKKKRFLNSIHRYTQAITRKNSKILYTMPIVRRLYKSFLLKYYDDWFKNIGDYDRIIVFDSTLKTDNSILQNLSAFSKAEGKFLYIWNKIDEGFMNYFSPHIKQSGFKIYSSDKRDCERFGLLYNFGMYYKGVIIPDKTEDINAFFCGVDKGRSVKLLKLFNTMNSIGYPPDIYIYNSNTNYSEFKNRSGYMMYSEYLQNVSNSRVLIELNMEKYIGLTMRVFESMFFNKKLITSNIATYESDFYNENNIFYIDDFDHIDKKKLLDFLQSDVVPYSDDIIDKYDIRAWVEQFI